MDQSFEQLEKIYKEKEAYLKRGLELKEKNLQQEIEILRLQQALINKEYTAIQSKETDQIDAAMAKAWGSIPCIEKNASGSRPNAKYAPLEEIIKLVKPYLAQNDLYIRFEESPDFILTTMVKHKSGQWIGTRKQLLTYGEFTNSNIDHATGGHLTYQKRYQLCLVLGIQPGGEDDDEGSQSSKQVKGGSR